MQLAAVRWWPLVALLVSASALDHTAVLDPDGDVIIHWTPDVEANSIVIRVEARTRGWAAIGFSPTGGMTGADIIMGWVADGKTHLQDMHAHKNGQPELDETSDVTLVDGSENGTHTVFTFRRQMRTCDTEHDVGIGMDTTRVIWALHEADPMPGRGPSYHGTRRGTRSVGLDGSAQHRYPAAGESESFVVGHDGLLVGTLSTYYHCSIKKIPEFGQKVHYTGYRVKLDPVSAPYVHHFVMYACTVPEPLVGEFDEYVATHPGAQCYSPNMPARWSFCKSVILAWAVGGEGEMFPEGVGLPLGSEHGGATYFMLETHYDNPHRHAGIVDSSGLEMFYTRSPLPMEAGVLSVGHMVTSAQIIPPGQSRFVSTSMCSADCTQMHVPAKGVKPHAVLLHAHLAGREITVRHIRDGRELPSFAFDRTYDFNYQQSRLVRGEERIMPGDTLLVECAYGTQDRKNITLGGFATENEMCLAFIVYYPRIPLVECSSKGHIGDYLQALGADSVELNGIQLPPVSGGDVWTLGMFKHGIDKFKTLMGNTTETKKEEGGAQTARGAWFNKAELSTMKVSVEGETPSMTLYEYLTSMEWTPEATEHLQAQSNGGRLFTQCKLWGDVPTDYRKQFAGPFPFPKYEPFVEGVREECVKSKAQLQSPASGAGRSLLGGATVALALTAARLLL